MIKRAGFNFIFVGIILSVFLLAGFVSAVNYVSVGTGNNQKYWSTSDIDSNPTSGSINCSFADSFLNDPVYFQNHSNRDLLVFGFSDSGNINSNCYGWRVPSEQEWQNLFVTLGYAGAISNLSLIPNNYYWTSTENSTANRKSYILVYFNSSANSISFSSGDYLTGSWVCYSGYDPVTASVRDDTCKYGSYRLIKDCLIDNQQCVSNTSVSTCFAGKNTVTNCGGKESCSSGQCICSQGDTKCVDSTHYAVCGSDLKFNTSACNPGNICSDLNGSAICKKTCASMGGDVCSEGEMCLGTNLSVSDTNQCCSQTCTTPAPKTCGNCGDGLFNICDKIECENLVTDETNGCVFNLDSFPGDLFGHGSCTSVNNCTSSLCDGKQVCSKGDCKNISYLNSCSNSFANDSYYFLGNGFSADSSPCLKMSDSNNVILNGKNVPISYGPVGSTSDSFISLSGASNVVLENINLSATYLSSPAVQVGGSLIDYHGSKPIYNCQDLQNINNNLSANYVLANDIDCSGFNIDPIGTSGNPFSGNLNGNNHVISGLIISRYSDDVGLFEYLTGNVSSLGIVNAAVYGSSYVGVLAGESTGIISNCFTTGAMNCNLGSQSQGCGGLVGYLGGVISDSYSTVNVYGYASVGGLVGMQGQGIISTSYSTGSVSGHSYHHGGLVGFKYGGIINNSYSTSAVSGSDNTGGLVGTLLSGTVSDSYSTGAVSDSGESAMGPQYIYGGPGDFGGLIGESYGTIINSYWDMGTSGRLASGGGEGKTTEQMTQYETFGDWNVDTNGNPLAIWGDMDFSVNHGYPYLLNHNLNGSVTGISTSNFPCTNISLISNNIYVSSSSISVQIENSNISRFENNAFSGDSSNPSFNIFNSGFNLNLSVTNRIDVPVSIKQVSFDLNNQFGDVSLPAIDFNSTSGQGFEPVSSLVSILKRQFSINNHSGIYPQLNNSKLIISFNDDENIPHFNSSIYNATSFGNSILTVDNQNVTSDGDSFYYMATAYPSSCEGYTDPYWCQYTYNAPYNDVKLISGDSNNPGWLDKPLKMEVTINQ